jgi:hypothetical protein
MLHLRRASPPAPAHQPTPPVNHGREGRLPYDDNGNRTGGGYATGPYNRITSDGTYDYEYDDEGNIVLRTRISDDYYTEYEWDHRNRLIGVTDFDEQSTQLQQVTYAYDAFNRLVSRTLQVGVGTPETGYFIYDGKNIVLALDDSADVEQRLLWGPAVDQILADESIPDGEVYWLLDDNLGTVRDVAVYDDGQDETTVANHIFYDAFGRRVSETDDTLSLVDLGYTGRYFDRATSLQWGVVSLVRLLCGVLQLRFSLLLVNLQGWPVVGGEEPGMGRVPNAAQQQHTQVEDCLGALLGPAHARELQPLREDRLARRLGDAAA